jgi:hypothetical protein
MEKASRMEKIFASCPSEKGLIYSPLKNSNHVPKEHIIQLISSNDSSIQFSKENHSCLISTRKNFQHPDEGIKYN